MIPLRAYILAASVAVSGAAGFYAGHRWVSASWNAEKREQAEQRANDEREARVMEAKRASLIQESNDAKDAKLRTINARLADALERLRERPDRLPESSLATCKGATGAELSGRDAAFLERFAARADDIRAELAACQDREHSGPVTP